MGMTSYEKEWTWLQKVQRTWSPERKDFDPAKHPRGEGGRFGSSEGAKPTESEQVKSIHSIFEKHLSDYKIEMEQGAGWQNMLIKKKNGDYDSSIAYKLTDTESGFDLRLADVYIPKEIRGKGVLTGLLSDIRKLPHMSGNLTVEVAKDQAGWKTITARSGFNWVPPKIAWPPIPT